MRISAFFASVAAIFVLAALPAQAQTVKGELSGLITSATGLVPANGAVDVYTTPMDAKGGRFVLMQVCVEDEGDVELSGTSMGVIVLTEPCVTFSPGLVIPVNETLTFTDTNNVTQNGLITGILSKK